MGFLGIGKKKDDDPLKALEELEKQTENTNQMQTPSQQQNFEQQNFRQQNFDQNDMNFGQQESPQKFDSFGNPMRDNSNQNVSSAMPDQYTNPQGNNNSKDTELILAKLDAIKSEMANINHRLDKLENNQNNQQQTSQRRYRW